MSMTAREQRDYESLWSSFETAIEDGDLDSAEELMERAEDLGYDTADMERLLEEQGDF